MAFNLTLESISYSLDRRCLFYTENLCSIGQQQFWGIISPNGRGKSHLLHVLAGLKRYSTGNILVNNMPLAKLDHSNRAKFIGILLQHEDRHHLYISVENYLNLGLYNQELSIHQRTEKINKICVNFKLNSLRDQQICNLSGGEFQRVRIAQLALQNPQIYLLDEPFNAIDPAMQHLILDYFQQEIRQYQKTVIMVTHDILNASIHCDFILTIEQNGLLRWGKTSDLLTQSYLEQLFETNFYPIQMNDKTYYIA